MYPTFNSEYSSKGIVHYRVPQWSVLGLLLFLFTYLPLHATSDAVKCEMFADNTTLDAPATAPVSVENELQKSINEVFHWCSKKAMVLHPVETKKYATCHKTKTATLPT